MTISSISLADWLDELAAVAAATELLLNRGSIWMLPVPEVVVLDDEAVDDEDERRREEEVAENWEKEELGLVSGDCRNELDELERVRLTPVPIRLEEATADVDVVLGVLYEKRSFLSSKFNRSAYFLSSLSLFC